MLKLAVVAVIVTALCSLGCQRELTDEDAARVVDAMLSDERYVEALNSPERLKQSIDLMMEHPTMQTTPEEDCLGILLMSVTIDPVYGLPSDAQVDEYCEWYEQQLARLEWQ